MSECNHDCSSCASKCDDKGAQQSFAAPANEKSKIGKVVAVVSGKGGVGKSLISSLLAVAAARAGKKVGILDADVTGPTIAKAFGITQKAEGDGKNIYPAVTGKGIKVISINMLLEDETQPVVWRGPVIGNVVKQFWSDVLWGELDYLFVDMPPGTGDVPLTVFQSLPVSGIVVATSPQDLVSMIVAKAVNMAKMMSVPILGLVENMAYYRCPDCGKILEIFGSSKVEKTAIENNISRYLSLPIDPRFARLCDEGKIEEVDGAQIAELYRLID